MSFLAGIWGKLAAAGVFMLAIAAAVLRFAAINKQSGIDQQKAKEAAARAQNLDRIQAAKEAGRAARTPDPDGMPDPFDRDNHG